VLHPSVRPRRARNQTWRDPGTGPPGPADPRSDRRPEAGRGSAAGRSSAAGRNGERAGVPRPGHRPDPALTGRSRGCRIGECAPASVAGVELADRARRSPGGPGGGRAAPQLLVSHPKGYHPPYGRTVPTFSLSHRAAVTGCGYSGSCPASGRGPAPATPDTGRRVSPTGAARPRGHDAPTRLRGRGAPVDRRAGLNVSRPAARPTQRSASAWTPPRYATRSSPPSMPVPPGTADGPHGAAVSAGPADSRRHTRRPDHRDAQGVALVVVEHLRRGVRQCGGGTLA